jgi:hypothetical protein
VVVEWEWVVVVEEAVLEVQLLVSPLLEEVMVQ